MRDSQKARVYAWEDAVVGPRSPRKVKIENAQQFVDGIFICEQLIGSPKVELMAKHAKKYTGCRGELRLHAETPAWIVLHELAHALTDDKHGPNFMGVYLKLLEKYADLSLVMLLFSLQTHRIKVNIGAQPCFVDLP